MVALNDDLVTIGSRHLLPILFPTCSAVRYCCLLVAWGGPISHEPFMFCVTRLQNCQATLQAPFLERAVTPLDMHFILLLLAITDDKECSIKRTKMAFLFWNSFQNYIRPDISTFQLSNYFCNKVRKSNGPCWALPSLQRFKLLKSDFSNLNNLATAFPCHQTMYAVATDPPRYKHLLHGSATHVDYFFTCLFSQ